MHGSQIIPLVLIVFTIISNPICAHAWGGRTTVRVHVAAAPSLTIKGKLAYHGEKLDGSSRELVVAARAGMLSINGRTDRGPLEIENQGDALSVGGKKYRGDLRLYIAGGQVQAVNSLPLEQYLASVLGGEMGAKWPAEALKAQAVVARSYVAARMTTSGKRPYDVDATVKSQVYKGLAGESASTRDAVEDTEGKILTYNGKVIEAYFHACCGGQTEDARALWGQSLGYLTPVKDPYCDFAPDYFWKYRVSPADLGKKLGLPPVVGVEITARAPGGRALSVLFEGKNKKKSFDGDDVRRLLGYNKLKSTLFRVSSEGGLFVFKGSGSGHGVGMCQWGAKAQAEKGRSYRDILKFYFPEADLDSL